MELVNTSPVPVDFAIVGKLPSDSRAVIFTAKATFRIEDNGQVRLEQEIPFPSEASNSRRPDLSSRFGIQQERNGAQHGETPANSVL